MGELAALGSALFWTIASLSFERVGSSLRPVALNLFKSGFALLAMMVTLFVLEGFFWPSIDSEGTWWLAASGIVGLTIGDSCFFVALNRLGTRRALMVSSLVPPATVAMAWVALGEALNLWQLAGVAVTVAGVVVVIRERTDTSEAPGQRRSDAVGWAFGILAALCQAGGNVLTKEGAVEASALSVSVVRLAVGSAGIAVHLAFVRGYPPAIRALGNPTTRRNLLIGTLLGTYIGVWLMNAGLLNAEAGVASTLNSLSPVMILPIAYFVMKEKLSFRAILGAVVAVVGVALLFLA